MLEYKNAIRQGRMHARTQTNTNTRKQEDNNRIRQQDQREITRRQDKTRLHEYKETIIQERNNIRRHADKKPKKTSM